MTATILPTAAMILEAAAGGVTVLAGLLSVRRQYVRSRTRSLERLIRDADLSPKLRALLDEWKADGGLAEGVDIYTTRQVRNLVLEHDKRSHSERAHDRQAHVPTVALVLFQAPDAQRYAAEWSAHLHQLIEDGELPQAKRDRRRLAFAAITLAVVLRIRRALRRAR